MTQLSPQMTAPRWVVGLLVGVVMVSGCGGSNAQLIHGFDPNDLIAQAHAIENSGHGRLTSVAAQTEFKGQLRAWTQTDTTSYEFTSRNGEVSEPSTAYGMRPFTRSASEWDFTSYLHLIPTDCQGPAFYASPFGEDHTLVGIQCNNTDTTIQTIDGKPVTPTMAFDHDTIESMRTELALAIDPTTITYIQLLGRNFIGGPSITLQAANQTTTDGTPCHISATFGNFSEGPTWNPFRCESKVRYHKPIGFDTISTDQLLVAVHALEQAAGKPAENMVSIEIMRDTNNAVIFLAHTGSQYLYSDLNGTITTNQPK